MPFERDHHNQRFRYRRLKTVIAVDVKYYRSPLFKRVPQQYSPLAILSTHVSEPFRAMGRAVKILGRFIKLELSDRCCFRGFFQY